MARGDTPKRRYSELIGRLALGQAVSESEIDRLPDPDLLRDAWLLAERGSWNPRDLDETDALLLALTRRLMNVKVRSG